MGGGLRGTSEKGEGMKKFKLVVTEWSRDVKDRIRNIVRTVIINTYGVTQV